MAACGPLPVPPPVPEPSVSTAHKACSNSGTQGLGGYAAGEYWDNRYSERACNFDWFFTYDALGELIRQVLGPGRSLPCLHVGCGNSTIQEGMVTDGFVSITNVDISQVVIDQMRTQHDANAALHYEVVDCRDMHQFPSGMFGGVVDKGTLDAVLCAHGGLADVQRYLKEIDRVLAPGGVFLLVTLGAPQARTAVFEGPPGAGWTTEVVLLPKPADFLAGEAAFSGRKLGQEEEDGGAAACDVEVRHQSNKREPPSILGPFDAARASQLLHDVQPNRLATQQHDFFFAYVCRKPGQLQAPKATLPDPTLIQPWAAGPDPT